MRRLARLLLSACLLQAVTARADVRVNDPTGEPLGTIQNSPTVAKVHDATGGDLVVVLWQKATTNVSTKTWHLAVSALEPLSFVQQGQPPAPSGWQWAEDPFVRAPKVDPFDAGTFYVAGQVITTASPRHLGVAFVRGHAHAPGDVTFDTPVLLHDFGTIGSALYLGTFTMGVHPVTSQLYLLYNPALPIVADPRALILRRSSDQGATWTAPVTVSADSTNSPYSPELVFGLGANDVTAAWVRPDGLFRHTIVSTSSDGGTTWGASETAMTLSGVWMEPPNRFWGTPAAVSGVIDRWNPAHLGEIVLGTTTTMNVTADVYPDLASVPEYESVENDGSPALAPMLETVGTVMRGTLTYTVAAPDTDYFGWLLSEGQPISFWCDSLSTTNFSLRLQLIAPNGIDPLAGTIVSAGFDGRLSYVANADGLYYLRVIAGGGTSGGYRIRTTTAARPYPSAFDQRDIALARRPAGSTWTDFRTQDPITALGCDETEINLVGASDGALYSTCTDYSAFPGSAISRRTIRRSVDGGQLWTAPVPISSVDTYWPSVVDIGRESTIRGADMVSDGQHLLTVWSDGRGGDRDIYLDHIDRSVSATDPPPFTASVHAGQTVDVTRTVRNNDHVFPFAVRVVPDLTGLGWPAPTVATATLPPGGTQSLTCSITVPPTAELGTIGIPLRFQSDENPGTTYTTYVLDLTVLEPAAVEGTSPARLALEAVAPNPMRGGGRLAFSLAHAGEVSLEILDVNGRRVRTLAHGELPAGPHEARWDGRDTRGVAVGAGAYFAVLHADDRRLTRRFVLMR